MSDFNLTLNGIEYKCIGSAFNKDSQNWNISAKMHDVTVTMYIPIESKVTRSKMLLFVEVFHEALMEAKKKQKESLNFPQQLT